MTVKFSFLFQFLFISLIFSATVFSQDREIFIPETQLGVLFEGATNHILIKRNEFETLSRQAREIRLEMLQDKDKPPAEAVLLSSDYRVEISELRAVIDGVLEIDVLTDDPVSIPLPLERIAVLEAVFDDSRQPVAMSDHNGQKILILSGKQRYRLRLRLTTPLEIDATRQRLNFRLPYGTETSFRLSVPGDVELKGGAAVLSRKVENGATYFDLLLPPETKNNQTEILMSLNSHRKGEYSAILVRSVQFAEVTEHYERLHATVSLNELHQGVREASFFVPEGFEITEVHSVFLDRWNVRKSEEKSNEKEKRDVLTIRFHEQVPGLTTIYLSAIKFTKIDTQWSFPSFEPLETAVHSAVLGLLLDEDIEMSHVESNRLFPINALSLKDAIPPGALELLPGSPTLRLVSAWYAPGKDELNKNVTAKFSRTETDSFIETVQNLILSEKEPVLQYTAKITPRTGKIFETTLEIPQNWNVLNVLDAAGQPLYFRSVNFENSIHSESSVHSEKESNHSEKTTDSEKTTEYVAEKIPQKNHEKIIVRFSKGVAAGESVQFSLRAVGGIQDWFQNNTEKSLQYPVIRIHGSSNEQGTISVQNNFEDDWEIVPAQTEHLTALNRNLSFQYSSTPFVLPFRLEKLQPRLKARTISFYCFEPALFHIRYEIDCFIEQASVRQLTVLLPASSPPTPTIQGLNGLNIKETLSEETEINGQKFRRWKILFEKPTSGKVQIGVNFEQPVDEQIFTNIDTETSFELPTVIVENTAWQSGLIAVEGDEELDLTIPMERNGKPVLRSVDAGEISVAVYRPGKRLLGVYSVTDPQNPITINVRKNQTAELLSALIRHVSVTAKIDRTNAAESNTRIDFDSNTGVLYSVLYEIQIAGGTANLRTTLNKSDKLWSITLDGEPIKAQRVGDDLLIPVSASNNNDFRRLVLLYHRQMNPINDSKKSMVLHFPALSLNRKNGNEKIQVMQTSWNIIPPKSYKIIRIGDLLLQESQPALFQLFHGVVGFFNVLTFHPVIFLNSRNLAKPQLSENESTQHLSTAQLLQDDEQIVGMAVKKQDSNKNFDAQFDMQYRNPTQQTPESEPAQELSESDSVFKRMLSKQKEFPPSGKQQFIRRLQSIQPVTIIVSEKDSTDLADGYSVIGNRNAQEIYVQLSRITVGQHWGWVTFLVVILIGLSLIHHGQSRQRRTSFVFGLLILGTILIFIPGLELFATIFNALVYGAALTGAVYLVHALWSKIVSIKVDRNSSEQSFSEQNFSDQKNSESKISGTAVVSVLFFAFLCLPVHAAEQNENIPKIQFPENAIIVPYSSDNLLGDSLPDPDKLTLPNQTLLVPCRQYTATLEIIRKQNEKIQSGKNVQNFAVPFAVSAAEYQTKLPTDGNDILLQGKINIDVFTDRTVFVPLSLENGVFIQPLLDGKPAMLHSTSNRQTLLLVEGIGRHELLFGIRVRIQRQGGWRIAAGKLPVAAVSKISLTLPDEPGDLLTGYPLDKKKWSFGTKTMDTNTNTNINITNTNEKIIETSHEPNGFFHWQWRSAVSEENVDRSLEVESIIRYDIQEGGVWIRWTPIFRISRGKWEILRLCLPKDYLIAEIAGENVRGWNIVQENSNIRTIDVELLKPAEKIETLSILLSAPQETDKLTQNLSLPNLTVPDAGIHRGQIDLFHSSEVNLRIAESTGLSPIDHKETAEPMPVLKLSTTSPFGLSLFRSFRFSSENYSLRFELKRIVQLRQIDYFSVLKITRQDVSLETKIRIGTVNKPFYETIQLPEKFVLKNVNVPDGILWNRESGNDKVNRLNIICPDGHSSRVEILVDGDFSGAFSKERNEIETLPLFKTEKTYTFITTAVLTEPSLDVRADSLKGIETSPPDSVFSWLLQPEQRELIRIVLSSSASTKGAEGKLILSERKPEIRCSTITNVRTTAESIEETTLLDFDIAKAGVRTIEFVLPAWMSGAKINAPFLRRKTVTPLDTKNTDSPVLVRLELLEEVMKQLRVLVQTDRRLQSETDYRVFVPVIRTGQTMRQYIVMENDRRSPDEMVVDRLQHLQALNRQQNEWNYLASILGGNVTESYFATKNNNPAKNNSEKDNNDSDNNDSDNNDSDNNDSDKNSSVNNDSGDAANLSFRMKRRETVQLADARIDLAETRFTLGDNGDYRAEQIYHIDNKKEPYLDILLPEAASLWGARILTAAEWQQKEHGENNIGLPVKPNMMPAEIVKRYHKNVTESRLIRIPLVKTESGDIDFIVRLIYAGELQHFSGWSRLDVPFIEVLNIPVGETLVRLNLPDRYEYQFKGNLRRVRQEQESETIRQIQSNYQYQQTDRLRQAVKGMNPFAAKRAKMNLKQWEVSGSLSGGKNVYSSATASGSLEGPMYRGDTIVFNEKQNDNVNIKTGSGTLTLKGSGRIEPDQSQAVVPDETATSFTSNSATLNSNFYNQSNTFSGQLVQQKALTINKTVNLPATKSSSSFNDQWFASNSLSTPNNATTQGETIYEVGKADRNRESGQVNHVFDQITVAGRQHESSSKVPVSQQQALHPPTSQVPQPQGSPHRIGSPQQAIPQQQIIPLIPQQQAVLPPAHPTTQVPQQQRNVQIVQGNLVLSDTTNGTNRDGLDYSGNVTFNSGSSTYQSGQTSQKEINASAVSSDERSLTERVKEQIENIASSPIDSATGSFDNRRSSTKAEPSSDRFSVTEGKNTTLGLSKPDDSSGQSGIANSNSISSTGHVTPLYSRPAVSERDGNRREESMRNRRSVTLEPVTPKTDQSAETATVEQILPALSMRTSSLDIEIPNTGKTFLFTASQGSLDLSFRTISNRTGSRGVQMLAAFLGLAFLYGIYCLCFSIGNRLTFDRRTHRNIAGLITLLSILSLILAPLVSVLSLIFAAILWITLFQRKSTTERL